MKLRSISISNVRSFNRDEQFADKIEFNADIANILIGPNGSGKSNLLEVLVRILTVYFFRHASLSPDSMASGAPTQQAIDLEEISGKITTLTKHWGENDEPQSIELILALDKVDQKNIKWVLSKRKDLKALANSFYNSELDVLSLEKVKCRVSDVCLKVVLNVKTDQHENKTFELIKAESENGPIDENDLRLILGYLREYEIINRLIDAHNYEVVPSSLGSLRIVKIEQDDLKTWLPLAPTLSIIDASSSLIGGDLNFSMGSPQEMSNNRLSSIQRSKSTSLASPNTGDLPELFFLKAEIANKAFDLDFDNPGRDVVTLLNKEPLITRLNEVLSWAINAKFTVSDYNNRSRHIRFTLELRGNDVQLHELSTGQRALFYLAVRLAVYEDSSGLFIIDEPENHLHPRLQKKMLQMLDKSGARQSIIATHSPVFVNEKTIPGVRRFFYSKENLGTASAVSSQGHKEKDLISFLNYTNSARIFFCDKVLAVEGWTDEYFFRAYLDAFAPNNEVEVLKLGSKNEYEKWKSFLDGWGIKLCFIGDYDNVKEFGIASESQYAPKQKPCNDLRREVVDVAIKYDEYVKKKDRANERRLKNAVDAIRAAQVGDVDPSKLKDKSDEVKINSSIEKKYKDGIYILKRGALESYLGVSRRKKGLEAVIDFCRDGFKFPDEDSKKEVNYILKKVIKS